MAYIDTRYLFQCETCWHHRSGKCDTWCDYGESYRLNMSKIPAADVVEVVRCGKCKHGQIDECSGVIYCLNPNTPWHRYKEEFCMYKHSFCSCGERRTDADYAEVKHGEWIETGSFDHLKTPIYQCSECWKEVADHYIKLHKHCLHCGAKMDGRGEV